MSFKVKLSIAFALSLLLVAGLFFFLLPPRDPAGGGAGATPESGTAVEPAARPAPADPAPRIAVRKKEPAPRKKEAAPREDPPPPGGGWTLSGRIVRLAAGAAAADAPGAAVVPAEGASVHLKPHPRRNKPGEAISPRTRKTGPDGRFEFSGVPAKMHLRFEVDEPSSAQLTLSFRLSDPDTQSRKELGDILIEPGADLTVHLVGPRGEPVEKATILMNKDSSNPKRSAYLEQIGFSESRRELTEKGKGVYLLERVALGSFHLDARAS